MSSIQNLVLLVLVVLSILTIVRTQQCDGHCRGFASMEGGTYGGGEAVEITVRTIEEFRTACKGESAAVIKVVGTIRTGSEPVRISSNKSVIGGEGATIYGSLEVSVGSANVIIRALVVVGTGFDNAVAVRGARNVWVDHCDISDSARDLVHIAADADLCTVSWNKFHYKEPIAERYGCAVGEKEATVAIAARVTINNNHFADNIVEGMAAVYGGQTHFVNNYSDYVGAKAGVAAGVEAAVLVEANLLVDLNIKLFVKLDVVVGVVTSVGNLVGGLLGAPVRTKPGTTFTHAPYDYNVLAAADVEALVKVCANVNLSLVL